MKDKELILLILKGSENAFEFLVNKYKNKVFNMAFSLTRNKETADDLTQEVFLKTYRALPKFRFKSQFGTWLYQIATNHIKDFLRRESRVRKISLDDIKEVPKSKENPELSVEKKQAEKQRREIIFQAIRTLPKNHQIILTLRDIQGYAYDEIAKILKISPGTVDSRLFRARKSLRKKISPYVRQIGESHEM